MKRRKATEGQQKGDGRTVPLSPIQDCFDADMSSFFDDEPDSPAQQPPTPGITFTVEQLEAMLAQAHNQQKDEVA